METSRKVVRISLGSKISDDCIVISSDKFAELIMKAYVDYETTDVFDVISMELDISVVDADSIKSIPRKVEVEKTPSSGKCNCPTCKIYRSSSTTSSS
jgi:hypothetical protein